MEHDKQGKKVKRYYWLKLKEDFFHDKEIKKLRRIAGGDTYTVIYLKLMLLSLKSDGKLYFDGVEDTFHEELALEIDEDAENVRITLMYLERMGLLKKVDDDEIHLTQMYDLILSESESAQRVRAHRSRIKALQCNTDVTNCNTYIEIEKEKELDKELILSSTKVDDCPSFQDEPSPKYILQEYVDMWNTLTDLGITKSQRIPFDDKTRASMLKKRLKDYGEESFKELIEQIKNSDFLQGKVSSKGRKPFTLTFSWAIHPENYKNIIEGKYRNKNNINNINSNVESQGIYNPRTGQTRIGQ